jgi:hypothetical protein
MDADRVPRPSTSRARSGILDRPAVPAPACAAGQAIRRVLFSAAILAAIGGCAAPSALSAQQGAVQSEKESRTPAQKKIDSQLLYEIYRSRVETKQKGVPPGPTGVRIDGAGRAFVDVRAEVTPALEKKVRALGGTIQSTSVPYRSVIAWVPLRKLESLAAERAVHAIVPAAEPAHK